MSVKVRIAPSPTGSLHVGTARTALFNLLFARHNAGEFILRIEDTDLERSDKKYEESIIEGLQWLGISWDNTELYRQSERLAVYRKYLEQLLESGKAFWCGHTKDDLEIEQRAQMAAKEAVRHVCSHKNGPVRAHSGTGIIRLAVEDIDQSIFFDDIIRGRVEWNQKFLGDISLAKDLETPLYNFAVVVDDIDMHITHVIRGEDHISNTPKQILIAQALEASTAIFAHLPLILGPDRSKMSKRHGATDILEYAKDYLPGAILNFLGSLGYTLPSEIMNLQEMVQEFDLAKVHKSGAIFDVQKLNWINAQYIRRLLPEEFKRITHLPDLPDTAVSLVTDRLERLSDVQNFAYFWEQPLYEAALLIWKKADRVTTLQALEAVRLGIKEMSKVSAENLTNLLESLAKELGDKGTVYWPLRVALSGLSASPGPIDLALVLDQREVIARVDTAIKYLKR